MLGTMIPNWAKKKGKDQLGKLLANILFSSDSDFTTSTYNFIHAPRIIILHQPSLQLYLHCMCTYELTCMS